MRFERIARDIDARFHRGDAVIDDQAHRHFSQTHPEHFEQSHRRIGEAGAEPEVEEPENEDAQDKSEECKHSDADKIKGLHAGEVSEARWVRKVYLERPNLSLQTRPDGIRIARGEKDGVNQGGGAGRVRVLRYRGDADPRAAPASRAARPRQRPLAGTDRGATHRALWNGGEATLCAAGTRRRSPASAGRD